MASMTVSSKGQVTLPVSLRRLLGIKEGDKIEIVNVGGKTLLEKTRKVDFLKEWAGKFHRPGDKPVTKHEIHDAAVAGAMARYEKSLKKRAK